MKNARAQLDRSRRLLPQQAATREQLDQAQADYDQAQGDLRRVQAQIEQKRIKAPFDGVACAASTWASSPGPAIRWCR